MAAAAGGSGRIQRRLALAIVLTALIPLLGAVYVARMAVVQASDRFFRPEVREWLDQSLDLYVDLARAEKAAMRAEATAFAASPRLLAAATAHDAGALAAELRRVVKGHPNLVSLSVVDGDKTLAGADRGRPVDESREGTLEVRRRLGATSDGAAEDDADDDGVHLVALFAADKARLEDGQQKMSEFVDFYGKLAERRKADEQTYVLVFAVEVGLTIALAIGVGTLLARGVSKRVVRLADATQRVGAGDLTTRVDETGTDELADLARAFNRMLAEVEASRARIEYLQRIGAWQEMARRLAHEIKNPLTPIQLAVEEIHERYSGADAGYRRLLDATLEVVEAEVGTLRRLVSEFSDFARLPQAHLEAADLSAFLREQAEHTGLGEEGSADGGAPWPKIAVSFEVPPAEAPAHLDRQMLRRALLNLIRNSAQAIRDQGRSEGRVRVGLTRTGDFWAIDVDDDGPGIPAELRERIFDPYVTTKHDGTGLGLAIVKKIVVEHGGVIGASDGPLGGARIRITVPAAGTAAARAALEREPASSHPRLPRPELAAHGGTSA